METSRNYIRCFTRTLSNMPRKSWVFRMLRVSLLVMHMFSGKVQHAQNAKALLAVLKFKSLFLGHPQAYVILGIETSPTCQDSTSSFYIVESLSLDYAYVWMMPKIPNAKIPRHFWQSWPYTSTCDFGSCPTSQDNPGSF